MMRDRVVFRGVLGRLRDPAGARMVGGGVGDLVVREGARLMLPLADLIAVWLDEHPGEFLVEEIARGVRARRVVVSEALFDDGRFASRERGAFFSDKARVWSLVSVAQDGPGRASQATVLGRRQSQNERLLSILRDGAWHTSSELHGMVRCTLNSRISELRKRGERAGIYTIEHEGAGFGPEFHRYRYVELQQQVAA